MKKQSVKTAKTVEEATALACAELGVKVSDVPAEDIHVLHYPKKSFFSFLKPDYAEVEVVLQISKLDLALEYIHSIIKEMGLEGVNVSVSEETEGSAVILLEGESVGTLIGRHGETLDALQYLTGLVANKAEGDYFRVSLDSGNYREKRKKTLESLARRMAISAAKTGRNITLEPMNPYERRIIHSTVQEVEGATSTSIGEEPNRRVVIKSTNPRPKRPRNDAGRSGGKSRRGGKGSYRRERGGSEEEQSFTRRERRPLHDSEFEIPVDEHRTPVKPVKTEQEIRTTSPDQAFGDGLYSKIEIDD
ncbi:MAG TPA: protein jag [Firmicutes bacterium]|nr:protein jag [Bacillota bacterium]